MLTMYNNKAQFNPSEVTNAHTGDHVKAFVRLMLEQGLPMQVMHAKLYKKYGRKGHLGKIIQIIKTENGQNIPEFKANYSHK